MHKLKEEGHQALIGAARLFKRDGVRLRIFRRKQVAAHENFKKRGAQTDRANDLDFQFCGGVVEEGIILPVFCSFPPPG